MWSVLLILKFLLLDFVCSLSLLDSLSPHSKGILYCFWNHIQDLPLPIELRLFCFPPLLHLWLALLSINHQTLAAKTKALLPSFLCIAMTRFHFISLIPTANKLQFFSLSLSLPFKKRITKLCVKNFIQMGSLAFGVVTSCFTQSKFVQ